MSLLLKSFFALGMVSLLSGCADLNAHFDCPMKPGINCKRVDEINTMVDRGDLTAQGPMPHCHGGGCVDTVNNDALNADLPVTPYPISAINNGDPLRYGETVLRIWVAPYEDTQGDYYQPTVLYRVVKPGHWIGGPVKALTNNEES